MGQREGVSVEWQKLLPPKGFVVLPRRRWVVVERTLWLGSTSKATVFEVKGLGHE
jgi:hypothetical protein